MILFARASANSDGADNLAALLQRNAAGEDHDLAAIRRVNAEELPRLVEAVLPLPHLELRGLMGVPPYFDDPEEARPYFRRLRDLRVAIRAQMGRELLPLLSMGMSHDFEVAIEEGATEIRIGTALFGERRKA